MTCARFDAARALVGFAFGYGTARTIRPCAMRRRPATAPACELRTPIINPRKESR